MKICEFRKWIAVGAMVTFAFGVQALASTPPADPSMNSKKTGKVSSKSREHKKGKSRREKDAEGTKAQNRFEPEINAKSPYQLGGHNLEVDTD